MTLVPATLAIGPDLDRTIYCTDAAGPASSPQFARVKQDALPSGADKVDLHVFPTRRPYSFGYSPAMFRALGERMSNVDLVEIHSLNLFPQLAAYIQARRHDTPYMVTPHGSLDPWLRPNSRKRKMIVDRVWQVEMLNQAAAIHFKTHGEAALAEGISEAVPRHVVPNGISVDEFRDLGDVARALDGRAFRNRFLDGHAGLVVLFLGRVTRKKGIDILLSAFARSGSTQDVMLAIVGPDDEGLASSLERQALIQGISARVRFLGPLYDEDRRAALSAADVWVLTSYTENFGNAVLEAMAARLPVIISTAVNTAAAIRAADAGVVTSLDIDEVAHQLDRLLASPERRRELGRRAAMFAKQYDWSNVGPRLAEMYMDVIRASTTTKRVTARRPQ